MKSELAVACAKETRWIDAVSRRVACSGIMPKACCHFYQRPRSLINWAAGNPDDRKKTPTDPRIVALLILLLLLEHLRFGFSGDVLQ